VLGRFLRGLNAKEGIAPPVSGKGLVRPNDDEWLAKKNAGERRKNTFIDDS